MYQPEDNGLAIFEIPSARETTDAPAHPGRVCPDTPGRECMLRYLYARKHNHAVKCATCGAVSSKVSAFERSKKVKLVKPADGTTAADRKRKYDREYERVRRERRKASMTPAQLEAERARRVASQARARDRNRDKINAEKREARARAAAAKLAAMTPERREAMEQKKRERALAALAKAHAKTAAKREADKAANAERIKERQRQNHAKRMEAKRLKAQATAPARRADREASIRASMELARAGKKPASRCEAVVMALEWMLDAGIKDVAMLDFMVSVNKHLSKKVSNSGALGRSVRDYGLTVRTEYRGKGVIKAFLYLDDKAREFVAGGFVKHAKGGFK